MNSKKIYFRRKACPSEIFASKRLPRSFQGISCHFQWRNHKIIFFFPPNQKMNIHISNSRALRPSRRFNVNSFSLDPAFTTRSIGLSNWSRTTQHPSQTLQKRTAFPNKVKHANFSPNLSPTFVHSTSSSSSSTSPGSSSKSRFNSSSTSAPSTPRAASPPAVIASTR